MSKNTTPLDAEPIGLLHHAALEARMDLSVHDRREAAPGVLPLPEQGMVILG